MNISNVYKPFIGLIFIFTVVSLLNIPILTTLWRHSFDDGTYSHAYLIPIISLYLYFKLSENGILVYRESISFISWIFLFCAGFLLFVTSNSQISIGYWLSFLAMLTAGVITIFRFNWYIIFPSSFLIFIFPLWGLLTDALQTISVSAVTYMMSFTGIPTYVENQFISIPAGVFEIADGCSGLRYIIVSLAISTLFIFMYINNVKKAFIFLSIAILGALLTNWIRITALILIGEYTDMQSSLMEDHNTFGWYLYIPFMFLLFMWGNKLVTTDLLNTKSTSNLTYSGSNSFNIVIALFTFIAFSTTVKSFMLTDKVEMVQTINNDAVQPKMFHATSNTVTSSFMNNGSQMYTYNFNGADLDAKPTYYYNQLIPEGWSTIEQRFINNWNVNKISKGRISALILYQYEINGEQFSTAGEFKKNRLIQGISGKSNTKLHWTYSLCKTNCNEELNVFKIHFK
jgi:exosortase A